MQKSQENKIWYVVLDKNGWIQCNGSGVPCKFESLEPARAYAKTRIAAGNQPASLFILKTVEALESKLEINQRSLEDCENYDLELV